VPDYLLDSCVLVRHLRRHKPTTDLVSALVLEGQVGIATISRTEIIEGMREHEREATMRLLDSLPAYPLDVATGRHGWRIHSSLSGPRNHSG
jgi:predicted nucleic acid-binding protein